MASTTNNIIYLSKCNNKIRQTSLVAFHNNTSANNTFAITKFTTVYTIMLNWRYMQNYVHIWIFQGGTKGCEHILAPGGVNMGQWN